MNKAKRHHKQTSVVLKLRQQREKIAEIKHQDNLAALRKNLKAIEEKRRRLNALNEKLFKGLELKLTDGFDERSDPGTWFSSYALSINAMRERISQEESAIEILEYEETELREAIAQSKEELKDARIKVEKVNFVVEHQVKEFLRAEVKGEERQLEDLLTSYLSYSS